jgi:hypothetical protein
MRPVRRESLASACVVAFGVMLAQSAGQAQQITVNPRWDSVEDKAPLAWREGDVFYLLNMVPGPREASGDWAMQPMITTTWGQPVAGSPTGWTTTRSDGTPLGKIYASGGSAPTDGTNSLDWGDGSLLRVSGSAAFKYNLPAGSILYSTRMNTSVQVDPKDGKRGTTGYGTRYRIMVFLSKDNAKTWSVLPPVAVSGKSPADERIAVGLWSNFLFERSDGTIQVYYDNELAAWQEPGGRSQGEQWLAMQTLLPGPPLSWTGQRNEIIVDGHQPGRPKPRTGMASVSEKSPSDGTMILTVEDVNYYEKPGDRGPRFQGVVRVLKSSDGGNHWVHVNTLQPPRGFNNLAPYHVRSKITGELILVCRSDIARMGDPAHPTYDPYLAVKNAAEKGNGRLIRGNLNVYRSVDDGVTWQPLEQSPGTPYRPGGPEFAFDPGVTELKLSPTSSNLIFQWRQFLGGLDPNDPAKTWVQTVTIRK